MMFFIPMTSAIYEDCSIYGTCEPVANIKDYFTQLKDTPSTYTGAGGQCVKVDSGESGLEFGSCGGAGGGLEASGVYLYNDSTTIYFNDTYAGENLAVNSSDYWDGLNSFNTTQMENNGGILSLIVSFWDGVYCKLTGCTMSGDLNMGGNDINSVGLVSANEFSGEGHQITNITFDNAVFNSTGNSKWGCGGREWRWSSKNRQSITGYLSSAVTMSSDLGEIALHDGSITGVSITSLVLIPFSEYQWNFSIRKSGVEIYDIGFVNFTSPFYYYENFEPGTLTFEKGDILSTYTELVSGSAVLSKIKMSYQVDYDDC